MTLSKKAMKYDAIGSIILYLLGGVTFGVISIYLAYLDGYILFGVLFGCFTVLSVVFAVLEGWCYHNVGK